MDFPIAGRPPRLPLRVLLIGNYANDRQESMQRFADVLAHELPNHGIEVECIRPGPWFGWLKPGSKGLGKWLGYVDKFILFPFVLRRRIATLAPPLVVHICDHSSAIFTRYLQDVPHLVTCHDLLALRSALGEVPENRTGWTGRRYQALIHAGLKRARRIACVSAATRCDLLRLSGQTLESASVIHNGLNHPFSPMPGGEARRRVADLLSAAGRSAASDFRHILHVGGNHWYKNRLGVLRIYAALHEAARGAAGPALPKLIMVGPALNDEMRRFLKENPAVAGNVASLCNVDNEDLRALYSTAELLLFPSLEEGFGWPIIEAQACGCRVVTTGKAPMTEIGGDAAVYLDGRDVSLSADGDGPATDRLAAAVQRVLCEEPPARPERTRRGIANAQRFSTEAMIESYVEIYREVAGDGETVRR